jgi:UDP-2,3-diacylglucosamine pyrophosphatase LpxH
MLDALIVSDVHLGSGNCEARRLRRLLERVADGEPATRRLIVNGDLFDSLDFRRLTRSHWKILSLLRKLSDHLEIIWLVGNHDGSADVVSHLLGVQVMDEYVLESGDRRILVLHGHAFDQFLDKHPILTWLGDCVYAFLQWMDRTHAVAKWAKHGSKTFLRCAKQIEEGAVERARRRGCAAVCCGHTHAPCIREDRPVAYYNGGCWTELPCHYLTVCDGAVRLHAFEPEAVPVPEAEVEAETESAPMGAAS